MQESPLGLIPNWIKKMFGFSWLGTSLNVGNFLFFFMLVFSVSLSLSSSSWLVCWMMMEVSSFFFVPILYGFWSISSVMIGLKYFLVQSIGSSLFLFSVFWESISCSGWEWVGEEKEMGVISCMSMMLKLGVFPFSGWMIHISENLSWKNFFLLSSIQEVIPLIMISKFGKSEELLLLFVFLGMMILVVFCFLNYSVHWMMMISSLFNVCWMVVSSLVSKESLLFFMLVYFSTLMIFFWMLDGVVSMGSLASMSSYSIFSGGKIFFIFSSFMMMGIPPLGNFLGKVEVLSSMISEDMFWMSIYVIFLSSVFMFLYLKVSLCVSLSTKGAGYKGSMVSVKLVSLSFLIILFLVWIF